MGIILSSLKSLVGDVGSDSAQSFLGHVTDLVSLSTSEVVRHLVGGVDGSFPEAETVFGVGMRRLLMGTSGPVTVVPVADVDMEFVAIAVRVVREIFGLDVRVSRRRPIWPEVYDAISHRLSGMAMLQRLESMSAGMRTIAITNIPMVANGMPVHGYAYLELPVAAVSLGRLSHQGQPRSASLRNYIKVIVHELGHTFRLPHCEDKDCVMHRVEGEIDDLSLWLCDRCLGAVLSSRDISVKSAESVPLGARNVTF